jgi:FkbM family methyltransferase
MMSDYTVSYAQNKEDIILSGFFTELKKGFYVDVGANHPDALSVTKYFYDRGWNGINLEPNQTLYKEIVKQRPRDININIGAADKPGELILREYPAGDGLSTFSKVTQKNYKKESNEYKNYTNNYEDHVVPVQTLEQIFKENKIETINFMNVDVEGFEYEVLVGNNWDKYRPQVICIEANNLVKDWRPLLNKAKYSLAFFDGLNNYYVADEHKGLAKQFSYVKSVLLVKPVVQYHVNDRINSLYATSIRQELVAQNLRQEIDRLNNFIGDQQRLRSTLKRLLVSIHAITLLHIEKLNKVKRRRLPPLELKDSLSPEIRLKALRLYDLKAYYGVVRKPPLSYRVARGAYLGTVRLLIGGIIQPFAKTARRVLRRG